MANPILANPFLASPFGQSNFGQSNFGQSIVGSGVCHGGALEGGPRTGGEGLKGCCVLLCVLCLPLRSSTGPLPAGPPSTGPPKISLFFPSPDPFSFSKRAHLRAPALQTPPKFNEKTPRERRKERKWERGKKSANGPRTLRGPTLRGPTHKGSTVTHTHPDPNGLVKIGFGPNWPGQNHVGQNWIGQNWSNQDGQNAIGQSRSLPSGGGEVRRRGGPEEGGSGREWKRKKNKQGQARNRNWEQQGQQGPTGAK